MALFSNETETMIGTFSMLLKTATMLYILYLQAFKKLGLPNWLILLIAISTFGLSSIVQTQKYNTSFSHHYQNLIVSVLALLTYLKAVL